METVNPSARPAAAARSGPSRRAPHGTSSTSPASATACAKMSRVSVRPQRFTLLAENPLPANSTRSTASTSHHTAVSAIGSSRRCAAGAGGGTGRGAARVLGLRPAGGTHLLYTGRRAPGKSESSWPPPPGGGRCFALVQPVKAAFARARAPRGDTHALDAVFANVDWEAVEACMAPRSAVRRQTALKESSSVRSQSENPCRRAAMCHGRPARASGDPSPSESRQKRVLAALVTPRRYGEKSPLAPRLLRRLRQRQGVSTGFETNQSPSGEGEENAQALKRREPEPGLLVSPIRSVACRQGTDQWSVPRRSFGASPPHPSAVGLTFVATTGTGSPIGSGSATRRAARPSTTNPAAPSTNTAAD